MGSRGSRTKNMSQNNVLPHSNCQSCYLSISSRIIAGGERVVERSDIVFINLNTTSSDIRHGNELSHKTDRILRDLIIHNNLQIFSTTKNVVRCQCYEPSRAYIKKCFPILLEDLIKIKPKIIVTIGSKVHSLFVKNVLHFKRVVNKPIVIGKIVIIPIYDPVYVKRNNKIESYNEFFKILRALYSKLNKDYRNE